MKYIAKTPEPPKSIREWVEVQVPVGLNLDYPSFTRVPALRQELTEEQHGLCPYTGAAIDDRLPEDPDESLAFQSHIDHVKPRSLCQAELEARGGVYGRQLCEDMDHRNLVAALEVKGKRRNTSELFGAAARENAVLPVNPLAPDCEERFVFDSNGGIRGVDHDATTAIELLKLDHATLTGWRRSALDTFFPFDQDLTREDIQDIADAMSRPVEGRLPAFSFCIQGYARFLLS